MSRIKYEEWRPSRASVVIVNKANEICAEYAEQGYDLTLRQLYYQFVARDLLANNQRNYKNLGAIIDKARKAGLMDWKYIVDRTRNLAGYDTYADPAEFIDEMSSLYHTDVWADQAYRVEVWVEKEALAGVVSRASLSRQVDYFSCRGYVSQSELHAAAKRLEYYERQGKDPIIIHLGDHDPSGIDMTRDIEDRMRLFGANVIVKRIALNADQIERYSPPPNPTKLTDSRADGYIEQFGYESWELDALEPATLVKLITDEIDSWCDIERLQKAVADQEEELNTLAELSCRWEEVTAFLGVG